MSNTVGDAQIKLGLDASGVVTGIGEAKKSIDSLGASTQKAVGPITPEMEKASAATQRFAREVVKTEIALLSGGKQTAAYKQAISELNGLGGNALKPYLESLRATEQAQRAATAAMLGGNVALTNMGMTAKATTAALRQVPAQFTDIIVSLQGGQAPLTVLLQQGGQLKDVFGGVGNAARALGGYVLGLVNPFTVTAAAVTAIGFAFDRGAQEQRDFQKTLILTGNAAGVTANLLSQAAANIDAASGATQGKAAEALNIFVNAGVRGRESLERFTASAIEFERAGGGSIEKVAENFAKLGKDPLKASLELNDSMNFLTRSLYEQIKALEDQGRSTEAAKVAQEAYNASLNDRTPQLLQNLGLIERGWKAITDATKGAYDAALQIGRTSTPTESQVRAQLESLSGPSPLANEGGSLASRRERAELLKQELQTKLKGFEFDKAIAVQDERRLQSVKTAATFYDAISKYATKTAQAEKEIAQLREKTNAFLKGGASPEQAKEAEAKFAAARAQILENAKPKGASSAISDSELTNLKARVQQEQIYLELLKTRGLAADKLNEGEKAAIRLQEELKGSLSGRARSIKEAALEQANLLGQTISQAEAERAVLKATDEAIKAYESLSTSIAKSVESIQAQIEKENAAAAAVGKTKEQIAALEGAKLEDLAASKDRLAVLAQDIDFSGALTAKYTEEAAALRKLAAAKQNRAGAETANAQLVDQAKAAQKALDDFQSYLDKIDTSKLDGLFNGSLKGIDKLITATKTLAELNQKSDKARAAAIEKYGEGSNEVIQIQNQSLQGQLGLYSDIAGAAKTMFEQGSEGYKAMEVAQSAFGLATAVAAVANQGLGDPYTAIPRILAMVATMSQLGFAINGLSGGGAAATNQGTGTVFGDATAKSASIDNSIKILETSRLGLKYSEQMARSLKNIEAAFAGVTNLVLRNGQISNLEGSIQTGASNSSTGRLIASNDIGNQLTGGALSGFFNGLATRLFGNRVSIQGSGIVGGPQSFGDIQDVGFQGNYYADIETKKRFLGITRSTTNSTVLSELDDELSRQFTQIFTGIGDSVTAAGNALGIRTQVIQDALSTYIVDIGKIDLKGLNGEEIQEKLAAVFGAEFDKLALAIIPGLESIQQVGEGYGETLVRAATQLESVNTTFGLLGGSLSLFNKSADVFLEKLNGGFRANPGIDRAIVADQLVQQFGGLEEFNSATQAFYESFYSQGERTRATLGLLSTSLEGLGITLPNSIQSWRDLTTSLDVTTEAGQQAFEALITLGPAFAELQNQLLDAAGISGSAIADVLRDGMLARITQADVGAQLSSIIVDGIYNSLANGFAEQISQTFTSQIIAPLLQSVATGGVLSASISQASIDAVVATATNAANQLTALLGDAGFQQAIAGVQAAISGITSAIPGLTAAAEDAAVAQNKLLESAGITSSAIANVLRDGMLARITQEDIGAKLSGIIVTGIYNSLANGFAEQITQTFTSQIIAPLLQSVATGGVLSASISQASIDAVVASATNAATQLAAILGDSGFQAAIAGVQAAISGIAGAFPGLASTAQQAAPAYQSLGSAVESASDAASEGVDAWKSIGESLTDEIDRIRGELSGGDKASALASFASLTAQTRAGDLEAGKLLPSASQAYIRAVEESAASLLEVKRAQGFALSSLAETRSIIGQGPASNSPASFSPNFTPSYSPSGAVQQNSDALIAEVKLLRAKVELMVTSSQTTADVLDKASRGNQPLAVEVQT